MAKVKAGEVENISKDVLIESIYLFLRVLVAVVVH